MRAQGGTAPGDRRDLVAGARHRHGRGRPRRAGRGAPSVASGLQRIGRAGHQVGAPSAGKLSRSTAATCCRPRSSPSGCCAGRHRGDALPAQPARRARPTDRCDGGHRDVVARGSARRPSVGRLRSRICSDDVFRERAGHAGRAIPVRCVRGASPAHRVGSRPTTRVRAREGAGRLAIISGGTIPDRGLFGVFTDRRRRAGRRAGRGMCVRVPTRGSLPLGCVLMAHRGHHPRPGGREPRTGRTRQASLLEGARSGTAGRAGVGDRALHARAPREGRATTR